MTIVAVGPLGRGPCAYPPTLLRIPYTSHSSRHAKPFHGIFGGLNAVFIVGRRLARRPTHMSFLTLCSGDRVRPILLPTHTPCPIAKTVGVFFVDLLAVAWARRPPQAACLRSAPDPQPRPHCRRCHHQSLPEGPE